MGREYFVLDRHHATCDATCKLDTEELLVIVVNNAAAAAVDTVESHKSRAVQERKGYTQCKLTLLKDQIPFHSSPPWMQAPT